jgi:hypothetical protein
MFNDCRNRKNATEPFVEGLFGHGSSFYRQQFLHYITQLRVGRFKVAKTRLQDPDSERKLKKVGTKTRPAKVG